MKKILTKPQRSLLASLPQAVSPNRPEVKALIAHGLAVFDRSRTRASGVRLVLTEKGMVQR